MFWSWKLQLKFEFWPHSAHKISNVPQNNGYFEGVLDNDE